MGEECRGRKNWKKEGVEWIGEKEKGENRRGEMWRER